MNEELYEIQKHDPNGKRTRPTQADYDAFEQWAIATYGRNVWNRYCEGGWERGNDV